MPYAALLFSGRDKLLLPHTKEHIKAQFQGGYPVPMFAFVENEDLSNTFRKTGVVLAYTISHDCGKKLEKLVHDAEHKRLKGGKELSEWRKNFTKFWTDHGKELMHKFT